VRVINSYKNKIHDEENIGKHLLIHFIHLFVQRHRHSGQYKTKNMNSKQNSPGSGNQLLRWSPKKTKMHKTLWVIVKKWVFSCFGNSSGSATARKTSLKHVQVL